MDLEPLPQAGVNLIIGLLELLDDMSGKDDIYRLTGEIRFELGDILQVIEGAKFLRFIRVKEGDINLTKMGRKFLKADVNLRKKLFKEQIKKLKIFQEIVRVLKKKVDHQVEADYFLELFAIRLPEVDYNQLFHTVIDWGRYAELIGYNADLKQVYLDQEN